MVVEQIASDGLDGSAGALAGRKVGMCGGMGVAAGRLSGERRGAGSGGSNLAAQFGKARHRGVTHLAKQIGNGGKL